MSKRDITEQMQQTLRDLGLDEINWKRHVSASDVVFLLDQCPFLQIANGGLSLTPETETVKLQLITAKSGWKIHDFGSAMSSSPGELLFGRRNAQSKMPLQKEDEDGGGEGAAKPAGTLINQAVMTAWEMVDLARQHGWEAIQLIDGHPLMAWAVWTRALDSSITLEGFAPSAQDYAKRQRIKQSASETFHKRPSFG